MCDDLVAEVSELKAQHKELNSELAKFQKKAKKAKYYKERKQPPSTSAEPTEAEDKSDEEDPEVQVVGEGQSESF